MPREQHKYAVLVVNFVVLLNTLLLTLDHYGMNDEPPLFVTASGEEYTEGRLLTVALLSCSALFVIEAACKMLAYGPVTYFRDSWCRFEFFLLVPPAIVVGSYFLPPGTIPAIWTRTLRCVNVLRMVRVIKESKALSRVVMTLILSFPSLVNVLSLLATAVFMYAVLGVQLFTFVRHQTTLTSQCNFDTFGNAILTLFQCLTNDSWSFLMRELMLDPSRGMGCSYEVGDCGTTLAIPYFVSFQVIGSFVLLNLVVAVILENFTSLGNVNSNLVCRGDIEAFNEVCAEFDPDVTPPATRTVTPNVTSTVTPAVALTVASTVAPSGMGGVRPGRAAVHRRDRPPPFGAAGARPDGHPRRAAQLGRSLLHQAQPGPSRRPGGRQVE